MELFKAAAEDLQEIFSLYQRVTAAMEEDGLDCWKWGYYPSEEMVREDLDKGRLWIQRADKTLVAAVAVMTEQKQEYEKKEWTCGIRPGNFARLAVNPSVQGAGWGGGVLDDVQQILRRQGKKT